MQKFFKAVKGRIDYFEFLTILYILIFALIYTIPYASEDLTYIAALDIRGHLKLTGILLTIFLLYWVTVNIIDFSKISFKKLFLYTALVGGVLFPKQPMYSSDLYSYIYRARMITEYGANPYLKTYAEFKEDIFYETIKNRYADRYTIYGPLFLSIASIPSFLAGDSLALYIFNFKLLAYIGFLAVVYMIWKYTKSKKAVFLFAWNPLILMHSLVETHNDIYMIFLFLVGVYLIFTKDFKRTLFGWALVSASVLIKYFTAIFLPFVFLYVLSQTKKSYFIRYLVLLPLTSVIVVIINYMPFWDGLIHFSRLSRVSTLFSTLPSPMMLLSYVGFSYFIENHYLRSIISSRFTQYLFVGIYTYVFIKAFIKFREIQEKRLFMYLSLSFGLMLLFFFSWFHIWYLLLMFAVLSIYIAMKGDYSKTNIFFWTTLIAIVFHIFDT